MLGRQDSHSRHRESIGSGSFRCKPLKQHALPESAHRKSPIRKTQRSNPLLGTKCHKNQRSKFTPDALPIACPMRTFPYFLVAISALESTRYVLVRSLITQRSQVQILPPQPFRGIQSIPDPSKRAPLSACFHLSPFDSSQPKLFGRSMN